MLEKLAKQTAIYGISTILGRMLSYLLTPFYTRIFGVESYGIITDVYALIPFALVVLTMGMESSYFRFAAKAEAEGGAIEDRKRKLFDKLITPGEEMPTRLTEQDILSLFDGNGK